ncbi:dicarboxylate/amino acid:cation symporter [Noviherbaspirillum saxi]|uniref:Sodium:dicarboxylate symporter n=1 Tax=Noviherbaspirillum saxi TaxID=2320863 RepID=A0A3A3FK14_9BURK|nr:cation:dicarboxylase symporter family transporter [Noviherbaspirillum saxi]RJF92728.1 sodium:dicarboxylate symporter [Noviherbaspirillum saxi]
MIQKRPLIQLREIFQHPATLLAAVLLGGWTGTLFPESVSVMSAISTLYLSLIQVASLPFVVLAVFFGLQRLPSLPKSGRRLFLMIVLSVIAMLLCSVVGILVASLTSAGAGIAGNEAEALGGFALKSESQFMMSLRDISADTQDLLKVPSIIPDNFYAVLAFGSLPSVLIGALVFGIAVAAQKPDASAHLTGILEGIYRALESLVNRFNSLLPAAAFVLAAAATSAAGLEVLVLLKSFLGAFFTAALLICAASISAIAWRLKKSPLEVLMALREPITVCLFSPVAVAAVPGFIHSMSVRLGFSRGLVELYSPIAPVFVKAGEALFFSVLAIFIANLYGHTLTVGEVTTICLLSWLAALWSVGVFGVKSVIMGTFVMNSLGLPLEAVLPVFILIEGICEGARNLLSFLVSSALFALVSDGLYINNGQVSEVWHAFSITLTFSRKQALFGSLLLAIAFLAVFCAGVGFGLRKTIPFAI